MAHVYHTYLVNKTYNKMVLVLLGYLSKNHSNANNLITHEIVSMTVYKG